MSESREPEANQYRVILLSDTPAEEDEFSHKRVADAIAELIINEPEGGKAIALEGSWGSGKSTILHLIRAKLLEEDKSNLQLVIFDAWAHQDDPLRRSFLERLIKHLQHLKDPTWIDAKTWDEKIEELAKRRRIVKKKTIPMLTMSGTCMGVSFLLAPFGSILFASALAEGITFPGSQPSWKAISGLILALGPGIVLFCAWIRAKVTGKPFPDELSAFFFNKEISENETITDETPDPTSIEFETTFGELIDDALKKESERRLVIALDNLDRVSHDDALSILATLQVFLKPSQISDKPWFKRLWVIVPYDLQSLKNLWADADGNRLRKISFVEKLFQIRFEVPPLLLSDWRSYLLDLLREAFPDHKETHHDFERVYSVYDEFGREEDKIPTPRELKVFVNQIGVISRQWKAYFPVEHQAYYVSLRKNDGDIIHKLRQGNFPPEDAIRLLGDTLPENLAAMSFNTDVPTAQQLLLLGPLTAALERGNCDELQRLLNTFPVGFWEVMERIKFHTWLALKGYKIGLASAAILDIQATKDDKESSTIRKSVLRNITTAAGKCRNWWPLKLEVAEGLVSLIESGLNTSLPEQIANGLSNTKLQREGKQQDVSDTELANALAKILTAYVDNDLFHALGDGIILKAPPEKIVTILAEIHDTNLQSKHWKYFKPVATQEQIAEVLTKTIENHESREPHYKAFHYLITTEYLAATSLLKGIFDSAGKIIESANQDEEEFRSLIQILLLRKQPQPHPSNPINSNEAYSLLTIAKNMRVPKTKALALFFLLDEYPELPEPGNETATAGRQYLIQELFKPDQHSDVLDELIALVEEYHHIELVWELYRKRPGMSKEWVAAYLRKIIDRQMAESSLRYDTIFEQWNFVKVALEQNYRRSLFEQFLNDANFLNNIRQRFSQFEIAKADLYAELIDAGAKNNKDFLDWCQIGLKHLGEDKWKFEFNTVQASTALRLLFAILEASYKADLGIVFLDALLEHSNNFLRGTAEISPYQEKWSKLSGALETNDDKVTLSQRLLQQVRDAVKAKVEVSQDFFVAYGPIMAASPAAVQGTSEIIESLFIPLLDQDNSAGIRWMADLFERHPGLLQKCGLDNMVKHFEDKILAKLTENEEDASPEIRRLVEVLDLSA